MILPVLPGWLVENKPCFIGKNHYFIMVYKIIGAVLPGWKKIAGPAVFSVLLTIS